MAKRDSERTKRLRKAVSYMLEHGTLHKGSQIRLAEHFGVTRQRVHQIVQEQRLLREIRYLIKSSEISQHSTDHWVKLLHVSFKVKETAIRHHIDNEKKIAKAEARDRSLAAKEEVTVGAS